MDITQFEWDIIEHKQSFWKASLNRLLILLPFIAAVSYAVTWFSRGQHYVKASEMIALLHTSQLIVIAVILGIWHSVSTAMGPRLNHYKISSEGMEMGKKKTPLAAFQNQDVKMIVDKFALPYQEWRQERPADGKLLELTFTTNHGKIKILFPEEYVRQKFIRALNDYLGLSTNTNSTA